MSHNTIYDYLAERFRTLGGKPVALDDLILDAEREGYGEIWEVPRQGMVNAMRSRGIVVANGVAQFMGGEGENFDPIATDYSEFKEAAKAVLDIAEYPVPPEDLIARTGLHLAAIPMASMHFHLRQIGCHFLPGMGYWRNPQFTDATGHVVARKIKSERVNALLELFELHGWPISGPEAETWTSGLVTAAWLSRYCYTDGLVKGIGSGLYVPADKAVPEYGPIPMSRNVHDALAALDKDELIDDKDHLRLFRIALRAERLGWAKVKLSRTTRQGVRRQTMRVTWTSDGREALARAAKTTADAF